MNVAGTQTDGQPFSHTGFGVFFEGNFYKLMNINTLVALKTFLNACFFTFKT
jgi:hypothetical protein